MFQLQCIAQTGKLKEREPAANGKRHTNTYSNTDTNSNINMSTNTSTNINRNANVVLITAHCSNKEVQREGRQIAKLLQVSRRQSSNGNTNTNSDTNSNSNTNTNMSTNSKTITSFPEAEL